LETTAGLRITTFHDLNKKTGDSKIYRI